MSTHAGVVLELTENSPNGTIPLSCSGILVDEDQGLVLTSGILLGAMLSGDNKNIIERQQTTTTTTTFINSDLITDNDDNNYNNNNNNNRRRKISLAAYLNNKCKIKAKFEWQNNNYVSGDPSGQNGNITTLETATYYTNLRINNNNKKKSKRLGNCAADVLAIWKCKQLAEAFGTLFSKTEGWVTEEQAQDNNVGTKLSGATTAEDENLLHYFLLAKLRLGGNSYNEPSPMSIGQFVGCLTSIYERIPSVVRRGAKLRLVSTPFGNLSPEVFLGSLSDGIVSNFGGKDNILLMSDARCVPGCEGGAVFLESEPGVYRDLVGIVILPFCWRQSEWVGLTFCCYLRPLIQSLLTSLPQQYLKHSLNNELVFNEASANLSSPLHSVVVIKTGLRWGTGVIIEWPLNFAPSPVNKRLILTCSHVLQGRNKGTVRIRLGPPSWMNMEAEILYCTPKTEVYDVAVLMLTIPINLLESVQGLQLTRSLPFKGAGVVCVGHALFQDDHGLLPTITKGILSKIVNEKKKAVMLQTTCAVHPGASGGALISVSSGKLCGIVVCNTRDLESEASYPHISLCIPSTIISPVVRDYQLYKNASVFNKLHETSRTVKGYWILQSKTEGVISKL